MAQIYDRNNNPFTHIGVPFNYNRGNPIPLDNTSVWNSVAEAENYAKNSPLAYVGQVLTVVDKEAKSVSTYSIADTEGELAQIDVGSYAYTKLSYIKQYLYAVDYSDLDYAKAASFFSTKTFVLPEGPVIRKGSYFASNCDAGYDKLAEYVVTTEAAPMRHGSVAICGGLEQLTDNVASSKKYVPIYTILPFCVRDGINDAGVTVSMRRVPNDKGNTTGTNPGDDTLVQMSAYMLPRYVLDNFETAKSAAFHLRDNMNISCLEGKEVHLMIADSSETYLVEFVNNATVVTKMEQFPWMAGFHLTNTIQGNDGSVEYANVESHGHGVERFNLIADAYSGLESQMDISSLLYSLRYTLLYTGEDKWYSELCDGSLTIDKIESDPDAFDLELDRVKGRYSIRSRDTGTTFQTVHTVVFDIVNRRMSIVPQEDVIGKSIYFGESGQKRIGSTSTAVSFAAVWTLNSTNKSIDGRTFVPKTVDDVFGWSEGNVNRLYFSNGKWNLITTAGVASASAPYNDYELVFQNFPSAGDTTVMFRHESNDNADRLVTARELQDSGQNAEIEELFRRLGDGFYRLTANPNFLEHVVYYVRDGKGFKVAVVGEDYNVGDSVPENTFYELYTNVNITDRVAALESGKADKATTLTGYGITDASITGEVNQEVITLGSKTLNVATRSYVDGSVKSEADRAKGVEKELSDRLATRMTAYVKDSAMILTTGDVPQGSQED